MVLKSDRKKHHTEEYEHNGRIIVRRGQEFAMKIQFDRKISTVDDEITLQFAYGEFVVHCILHELIYFSKEV